MIKREYIIWIPLTRVLFQNKLTCFSNSKMSQQGLEKPSHKQCLSKGGCCTQKSIYTVRTLQPGTQVKEAEKNSLSS